MIQPAARQTGTICFHCGDTCNTGVQLQEKTFCCQGCKTVYSLLHQHELTNYYCLNAVPGKKVVDAASNKFAFLEEASIAARLISFQDKELTQVTFYLPQIHCSSCLYLLENLPKLDPGILISRVNFLHKKISISFQHDHISLRRIAELLAHIGYEPHISMQEMSLPGEEKKRAFVSLKLGVTGFCFANIMLISFPEYLGLSYTGDPVLASFFRYLNLLLALPVLGVGAAEFFINAFKSVRQKRLNIDAPIALAITITFCRSIYEILSQTGAGYLDSMSGIVFFMLIGRALQGKTSRSLRFNRDYKSYFPISVAVLENGREISKKIQHLKKDDLLLLHHLEVVPVDAILSKGKACIDYSFVTGENTPTSLGIGELIYAGGKVTGGNIEILAMKPFSQSSFTQLWNNAAFKSDKSTTPGFVDVISRYFSFSLLLIAATGFLYWQFHQPAYAWKVLTSVLIVACPCSLLLSSSFVYGFVMELFAKNGFFVKNTSAIARLAKVDHVVFDKTGTLTELNDLAVCYEGRSLNAAEESIIFSMLQQSLHPLSRALAAQNKTFSLLPLDHYKETAGQGMEAWMNEKHYKIGSAAFLQLPEDSLHTGSSVYISIDNYLTGCYILQNKIKASVPALIGSLSHLKLSLLSGDNDRAKEQMRLLFPAGTDLLFHHSPQQKLEYIRSLQTQTAQVLMLGDGLNDAGALKQSDVGISVVKDVFSFTPACDAVIDDKSLGLLPLFLQASGSARRFVIGLFIYSLCYNVVGLSFALSGHLQPVIAAILMSASSISIILLALLGSKSIVSRIR